MTENPNKLFPALIRARAAIQPIAKTATNPHFKNKYAPLGEVLSAVLPALAAEGLALVAGATDGGLLVKIVEQETGEYVASLVPLIGASDMQKLGGAMTYAMRYGVGMLLALELDDDDDGTKASQGGGQATAPVRAPVAAQGAQGSALPARPSPQPSIRSGGKRGSQRRPDPVAREDDAEAVWELCSQLDEHGRANPPAGGKSPFQIIKGDKLGIYGKIAERGGVEPGQYSLAQLASRGALPKLRGFYAYLCEQNGLAGWSGPPPTFEKVNPKFPDQQEADSVVDLTGGDDLPF